MARSDLGTTKFFSGDIDDDMLTKGGGEEQVDAIDE
jgi:hypothetical protein